MNRMGRVTLIVVSLGAVSSLAGCGSSPSADKVVTACSLLNPSAAASVFGASSMSRTAIPQVAPDTKCSYNAAPRPQTPAQTLSLTVTLSHSQTAVAAFIEGHRPGVALPPHSPIITAVTVGGRTAYWWSQSVAGGFTEVQTCNPSGSDCKTTRQPDPTQTGGGLGMTVNGYLIQITVQSASEAQAERTLAMMLPSLEPFVELF